MSLGRETIYVGIRYTNEDETLEDVVRQYSPTASWVETERKLSSVCNK